MTRNNPKIKLPSLRLVHMCKLVGMPKSFADVGCDHGFISINLAKCGKTKHIFAMDISEKCVNKAKENAKTHGVENKIDFMVSDGLEKLNISKLNTCLIAGMGGEEIIKIIKSKPQNLKVKNFILQPATKVIYLKQWLVKNGFKIQKDEIFEEKNKFYCFLKVKQGKQKLSELELNFGKENLKKPSQTFKKFLASQEQKIKKYFEQGGSSSMQKQLFLINEAKRRIKI